MPSEAAPRNLSPAQWIRERWNSFREAHGALVMASAVIIVWLFLFLFGTWVPASTYIQALMFSEPLPWDTNEDQLTIGKWTVGFDGNIRNSIAQIAWKSINEEETTDDLSQ